MVPFVARCRLIDGSMFHVQALIALFSGTEAPWVANEWTRGVRGVGGARKRREEFICVTLAQSSSWDFENCF